jgi:hypothetical protein
VANTFSSPMMPNVPNIFAPWTYAEILITVSGQQHTPVAQPKSLVTRQGCEGRVGGQLGSRWREAVEHHPARLVAHEVPVGGDDRPMRAIGPGARMGVVHAHPRWLGRPASARDDKEVS